MGQHICCPTTSEAFNYFAGPVSFGVNTIRRLPPGGRSRHWRNCSVKFEFLTVAADKFDDLEKPTFGEVLVTLVGCAEVRQPGARGLLPSHLRE
jgi:hypothetical protein